MVQAGRVDVRVLARLQGRHLAGQLIEAPLQAVAHDGRVQRAHQRQQLNEVHVQHVRRGAMLPPRTRRARSGSSATAFVNRGDDLLGAHVDAPPLSPVASEAFHRRPPTIAILILRGGQIRDRLAVTCDSHGLAVFHGP
jgi:hypothetical protein